MVCLKRKVFIRNICVYFHKNVFSGLPFLGTQILCAQNRYTTVQMNALEMCHKAVDNYVHGLEFVPDCFKTQKMCSGAVDTYPSTTQCVPK